MIERAEAHFRVEVWEPDGSTLVENFTAEYLPSDRISSGGGSAEEGEEIDVVELALDDAYVATRNGRIVDAKAITLIQHLMLGLRSTCK